jgi:hypothetical protein
LESYADDNKLRDESLRKLLSDLDKNPAPANLDAIILRWPTLFSPSLNDPNIRVPPEQKLQSAKRGVKAAISDSAEEEQLYDELLELAKQIKIIRPGNLIVVITIRNRAIPMG